MEQITHRYPHQEVTLTHQFRMSASTSLLQWMNDFTDGVINPLPADARDHYDFRVFTDAEKMRQQVFKRDAAVGLSRILSTSGYPSTLDGGKHYIQEGRFKMPWDQYNYTATPWAEIPSTINEVGSIYTCQGFDLNYAGIIIGPVIAQVPGTNRLRVNLDRFTDSEAFKRRDDLTDPVEVKHYQERLILNALNVILKRGVRGTYLYAHDPLLNHTIILLVLALVHDFMPEIRLLMDLTPAHRAELLTMIRSNGIRDLIFMLLLVGVMNAIPGLSNAVIYVFVGLCYGPWIGLLVNWAGNILGNCAIAALLSHVKLSHNFKQNKILDSLTHHRHPALGLTVGSSRRC